MKDKIITIAQPTTVISLMAMIIITTISLIAVTITIATTLMVITITIAIKDIKNDKNGRKNKAKRILALSTPHAAVEAVKELNLLLNKG